MHYSELFSEKNIMHIANYAEAAEKHGKNFAGS